MIDRGKQNVLGVLIDAVDYDAASSRIVQAARDGVPLGVTALAVHGLMEGVDDPELRYRLNHLDLVTPDGQPVRWALNLLHDTALTDRCYGPTLMLRVCTAAAAAGLPIYLHGSLQTTLESLERNLVARTPGLEIAGSSPSVFGRVSSEEMDRIAQRIETSGARMVFVGLGCPRQEIFAYEMRHRLDMPVIAVGAAFDYHSGGLKEPPSVVQAMGLQWLWRLLSEPSRLWRRYARTNPPFMAGVARQRWGRGQALDPEDVRAPTEELGYA